MAYEIAQPLVTTENTVIDRTTGEITGETKANIIQRPALPTMAWEGLTVLDSGVIIARDELLPGTTGPDIDGGAIFKFIPDTSWNDHDGIENFPLASGSVYAMQVTCVEKKQQFGQGCEVGHATWVGPLTASEARTEPANAGATGYYRPEDLHRDPLFVVPEDFTTAVRFCQANTGRIKADNFGEVMCAIDHDPFSATIVDDANHLVTVNRFIEGDSDFNAFDNLAFQPKTGNLYVIEDNKNGDIFAYLPDGADRDIKSDGCIKILSVVDSSAEPTSFFFTNDGQTAYVSIQHSNEDNILLYDDYPTDDVL